MEIEIWKDIPGYKGAYQASSFGNIKSLSRITYCANRELPIKERILRPYKMKSGYLAISLRSCLKTRTFLIHRLIAITFIPNPENKPEVNHKNGVKSDNRVIELEWVTPKENGQHAKNVLGLNPEGALNRRSKMVLQVSLDGFLQNIYDSINQAAKQNNIAVGHISDVMIGKRRQAGGFVWLQ
jgi:hypothetical protein